ncbi:MAG: NAD(P)H-hydrate dehydratase, partial [Candidatus Bipolaricaulis sp.]|nr:NAD(P)H-hydrate dehydratase [Candidatus Bipolaricaulis sp.]
DALPIWFTDALAWGTLAVDGLFGTGLSRPLDGLAASTIRAWNAASIRTVSLDVPSGALSDSGDIAGPLVSSDVTLAMEFLKTVHLLFPAASRCGSVAVVPVDYPDDVRQRIHPLARVLERSGIAHRLPPRPADGHKGTFGRVLVVAGSVGMTGAAILVCRGALRVGAGLVVLAIPASLDPILELALPEVITVPVPETGGRLGPAALGALRDELARADVLAIGPGLSRAPDVVKATLALLREFRGPCVVDADALYALSREPELVSSLAVRGLLTPHPGELALLTGESAGALAHDRMDATRAFVESRGVTTVLKGRPTVIGLRGGDVYLNPTGNTGLATGGSGDVLTGILAGLIGGGASIADAALVGPYLHGMAAESFASDRSERSLLPSDVIDLLPSVLREVEQCG